LLVISTDATRDLRKLLLCMHMHVCMETGHIFAIMMVASRCWILLPSFWIDALLAICVIIIWKFLADPALTAEMSRCIREHK
jgi:hypothetical protein